MIRRLSALLAALAFVACAEQPAAQQTIRANGASLFSVEAAQQWRLPGRLVEISGLAVTADGRLLGHDDERAVIYELDVESGRLVMNFAVGDPIETGDFEGLALSEGGDVFLVTSTGRIYRFSEGADGEQVGFDTFDSGLEQVCEIEGLAYHGPQESLILACKTIHDRHMRETLTLYAWSTRANAPARAWLSTPLAEIAAATGQQTFHPSAVEIDAASGRVIVIAARERAMVELDQTGAVIAARRLDPSHRQAEGAAILPDGALVVADEGARGARAQLTRYARVP